MANEYRIYFNANGGSGSMTPYAKSINQTITLPACTFTRSGYYFSGWATSANGPVVYPDRGTYSANASATLYAVWRTYSTPNPVTSLSLTRNSDSKITATWTNDSVVPRDYTKIYVNLQVDTAGSSQVAALGGTATNYSWTGAQPNRRYRVAVRPYNPAGYGTWAWSGYVYTTPAKPTSVTATVPSAGTVDVAVVAGATWATSHDVEVTSDGGVTWSVVGTVAGSGGTFTDTNPPVGTCQYRARAVRGSLYSAYVMSAELIALCPPLAPTLTSYPPAAIVAGGPADITWRPNHPDGTEQTKAEVEVTVGGVSSTISINDGTTTVDLSTYVATPATVSARVRTYGIYAAWGAWSDTVTFTSYDAPVVTVDAPSYDGEVMTALPVTVSWTATDGTGIAAVTLQLFDADGVLLRTWALAGNVSTFDLDRGTYYLSNNTTYSVTVTVQAGSTLQASASREFEVAYVGPGEPSATTLWDESDFSCAVTVAEGDDQGGLLPATDHIDVVRVMPDGSEYLIAGGIASSEQAVDQLPPLGVGFTYRIIAVASSGAETSHDVAEFRDTSMWAFGFGAGVAETALLIASPSAQASWQHGGESYHFADGTGETLPVFYGIGTLDVGHSWSFVIPKKWRDTAEHVQRLFRQHATCWVRDPFGHRWFVSAKATVKVSPGPKWDVSVTADELRFKEA